MAHCSASQAFPSAARRNAIAPQEHFGLTVCRNTLAPQEHSRRTLSSRSYPAAQRGRSRVLLCGALRRKFRCAPRSRKMPAGDALPRQGGAKSASRVCKSSNAMLCRARLPFQQTRNPIATKLRAPPVPMARHLRQSNATGRVVRAQDEPDTRALEEVRDFLHARGGPAVKGQIRSARCAPNVTFGAHAQNLALANEREVAQDRLRARSPQLSSRHGSQIKLFKTIGIAIRSVLKSRNSRKFGYGVRLLVVI